MTETDIERDVDEAQTAALELAKLSDAERSGRFTRSPTRSKREPTRSSRKTSGTSTKASGCSRRASTRRPSSTD